MSWSNMHKPVNVSDDLSLLAIMGMLLLDSFIFCVITWYVDAVKPGEYGVPLPLYFPFTVSTHSDPFRRNILFNSVYMI